MRIDYQKYLEGTEADQVILQTTVNYQSRDISVHRVGRGLIIGLGTYPEHVRLHMNEAETAEVARVLGLAL